MIAGTEDWHKRFFIAGVPLVMLAEPSPLAWVGSLTSPFRGRHGGLVSLLPRFDIFQDHSGTQQREALDVRLKSKDDTVEASQYVYWLIPNRQNLARLKL